MTEPELPNPRPVSILAVAAIFALLSLYGILTLHYYAPNRPPAPQNEVPDHLPKELAWRATPADRRAFLQTLRDQQAQQALSYGWVDKKAGIVQLPIERAMQLIVDENGGRK
jgi:hypothetical protein